MSIFRVKDFPQILSKPDDNCRTRGCSFLSPKQFKKLDIKWKNIFDSLKDPIMILDIHGRVISSNSAMASLLGSLSGHRSKIPCCKIIHGVDEPDNNCPLEKMKVTKSRQSSTINVRDNWYNVIVDPLFNNAGHLVGAVHVMYDVTAEEHWDKRDLLTRLYNRNYFERVLNQLKPGSSCGVLACNIDGLKLINDSLGYRAGDTLIISVARILRVILGQDTPIFRVAGDSFAGLLVNCTRDDAESAYNRIIHEVKTYNSHHNRELLSLSAGYAYTDSLTLPAAGLLAEAEKYVGRQKLLKTRSSRSAATISMLKLLKARDLYTENHCERAQQLTAQLALNVQLSERSITDLGLLARFHDIGKIGVSDTILLKPGPLTDEEFIAMTRHCEIGYHIASSIPDIEHIADWILKHHEWWNGNGYPLKISGEEIPLECRIMAIADAFDAMVSDRPYRKAMSSEKALAELHRCSGSQFDPNLVQMFIKLF